ncbi:alpha-N-acetylgalactosaminide alpha-2,6-sialyltransferase 2 [Etheostoma spectabile]|uniref:alpha-N-acetylgalactosaminide alpha-2,6-sialyltransferase 2 n=1 Tax=Etheostoma spectabile TaxID=54343 RepID=UPI0013AEAC47|nr:alpha-N-acetylgalactosaminide alpha-2,6-sialyltransferase 2-like [Etheostoma spectabile]XP_032357748.1 alpha-N-acetylgalactosaminide alpha-2,6-sialyltransferase 2-like [Etheostoma spectabile]
MALQRRLALGALTGGSLLLVYILCVNLESPLSWPAAPPKQSHGFTQARSSSSRDSAEPLDRQSNRDQCSPPPPTPTLPPGLSSGTMEPEHPLTPTPETQTATAAEHTPAENNAPDNSKSRFKSGVEETGSRVVNQGLGLQDAGPTEPPFIGDKYMSEDVPPQTNCSDGIRRRVNQTALIGRFLEGVPVLQWAGHVTREQHQRLSRYPGAHGWGGIEYKTLVETLSVLNSSANRWLLDDWTERRTTSECIRCAVVGNGGILKDSKNGKDIDGHHYVFRTNGAIIEGFEQDVGSRTTHYTFSTNTLMNSMRSYAGAGYKGPPMSEETRYVFLPDHDRDYLLMKAAATHTRVERGPEKGKDPAKYFGQDVSAEKLKMYHPDFIRYLRNRFLRSKALKTRYKDIYRPSTGAVMLLAALHTCDQVSAYGFMTPDFKNYSDHYYEKSYHPVGFFINHDLRMEMSLWQELHQAGLIRLYMHEEVGNHK